MELLKKQLKKLNAIEPNAAWAETTRRVVLMSRASSVSSKQMAPQRSNTPVFSVFKHYFIPAGVAVAALFVLIAPLLSAPSNALASLDNKTLTDEMSNLSINIHLDEISYQENANKAVATALTEITDTRTPHMSPSLIESESEVLNVLKIDPEQQAPVDAMLESVIQ